MSATDDMKVDPARASTLITALHSVSARISYVAQGREVSGEIYVTIGRFHVVERAADNIKTNKSINQADRHKEQLNN